MAALEAQLNSRAHPAGSDGAGNGEPFALESTRFGRLLVEPNRVLHFESGLIGLPYCRRFVALSADPLPDAFRWLQSIERPELALLAVDPTAVVLGYAPDLPADALGPEHGLGEAVVVCLVTVPDGEPRRATVNLLAPLVIDPQARRAAQVVLDDATWPLRHPLFPADGGAEC